jgi:hypothetical protein
MVECQRREKKNEERKTEEDMTGSSESRGENAMRKRLGERPKTDK